METTHAYRAYFTVPTGTNVNLDTVIEAGLKALYGSNFEDAGFAYETDYEDSYEV